jgi:dihydroorotate dehydrogenase electron transfer subunit
MKVHTQGIITRNDEIAPGYFRLEAEASRLASQTQPGQFVHVLCSDQTSPFLRRPLSLMFAGEDSIGLVYKVVGEGTALLARKQAGEKVDLVGPLGSVFEDLGGERVLFAAGGIGVVPLVYLACELSRGRERIHWVYGANSSQDILLEKEIQSTGAESIFATMDGTRGLKGTVIDALDERYSRGEALPDAVYACGPEPMLKALWQWMEPRGLPGQFSLENRMGCGVGACLGCVVPKRTKDGSEDYLRVCHDGPVVNAADVIL